MFGGESRSAETPTRPLRSSEPLVWRDGVTLPLAELVDLDELNFQFIPKNTRQ